MPHPANGNVTHSRSIFLDQDSHSDLKNLRNHVSFYTTTWDMSLLFCTINEGYYYYSRTEYEFYEMNYPVEIHVTASIPNIEPKIPIVRNQRHV